VLEPLIRFSVRNRLVVLFGVLLVAAVGLRSMHSLPIDAVPDVTNIQVQVLTSAPALGPLEIEQFVTYPIESVMSGLPHLEEVRSISNFGLSQVTLVFEDGTDIYFARQLVAERLADAKGAIPEGYGEPELGPISTGLGEIYQFEVRGDPMCRPGGEDSQDCHTLMELRSILEWDIVPQLRSVPGVVEVNTQGGELKTYQVAVEPERLRALGIGLGQVVSALRDNNGNAGGAYIVHAGEQRLVRGEGLLRTLDDIRHVVVTTRPGGTPVTIADLGEVRFAPMVRHGAVTRDGRGETVAGIVMMLMGANSRDVAQRVEERVNEIRRTLPAGVSIDTFYDRTELVDRTIHTVAKNLLEGGALVILVLLLLLGDLRGGLLVATAIPLSMLAAFIGMSLFGLSGNLMSLGAIDFGLIVDGSVVVVENAVRLLAQRRASGMAVDGAVERATLQVARPVAFAVGIIMIVYLPILTLRGIEGKMFRPMALTVLFALGGSLILALTAMPALATLLFRSGVLKEETRFLRWTKALYEPLLDRSLRRWRLAAAVALAVLVAAVAVAPFLGAEFVPTLGEGALSIEVVRLASVSVEQAIDMTSAMEKALRKEFPHEVDTVVSRIGRAEIATDPMGVETSDVVITLKPRSEWRRAHDRVVLAAQVRQVLNEQVPGQVYEVSQPIEQRTNELVSGTKTDVAVSIYGDELDQLQRLGKRVADVMSRVPGASGVRVKQQTGSPFLRIEVDRGAIARYGVNASDVLDAVSAIGGVTVGEVFEGQRRFPLQVRFAPAARAGRATIADLPIRTPAGTDVPLGELAHLVEDDGPAEISRDQVHRRVVVQANVRGRDLAGFVSDARQVIGEEVKLPPGYFIRWGGQFKNLAEASARLAIAVPVALLLIFFLLLVTYDSFRAATIIYLNVPIAATGGIFALALRGMPFSISAGVGFIALFGVAVLNGVVMVSYIRELQAEGRSIDEATRVGALTRLRPVLMTALVASLGFIPMAVSTSAGAEVQRPLATVVIGGLVTATLLTLLVLPAVYRRFGGGVAARAASPNGLAS